MWDIIVNCTQPWLRDKFHILSDNEINVTYWARDTTVKNHVHPVPVTHYSGRGRPAVMKRTAYVIDTIALHCGADEALSSAHLTQHWRDIDGAGVIVIGLYRVCHRYSNTKSDTLIVFHVSRHATLTYHK